MKFKGDIIITDPCYIIKNNTNDWNKCSYGSCLDILGIHNCLVASTEYGDWSCTTLKEDPKALSLLEQIRSKYMEVFIKNNDPSLSSEQKQEMIEQYEESRNSLVKDSEIILGEFCADAGLVGVFLLEEVLKYNPEFNYHIEKPWTTTLINNFDGDIEIAHRGDDVSVIGKGNINFYTAQTGL